MFRTVLPEKFFPAHSVEWSSGDTAFDVIVLGFDGNLMFERVETNFLELYDEFEESEASWLSDLFEYLGYELDYLNDVESVYQPLNK